MTIFSLPAATSEYVDLPVTATTDPALLVWEAVLSDTSLSRVDPAPVEGWAGTVVDDNGVTARPRYTVRLPVNGVAAGIYGMWLRVAGDPFASPVRFAGRLRLY